MTRGEKPTAFAETLEALSLTKEEFFAALFGNGTFPTCTARPIVPALLFLSKREWAELKTACKEAAGWQCQFVYTNGQRCKRREGDIRYSKKHTVGGKPRRYIDHMHACHLDNDPENPQPRLVCLCATHHTKLDRKQEKEEGYVGQGRKGYRITTTDELIADMSTSGILITETENGYHWQIVSTEITGTKRTASQAVSTAVHQLRCLREMEHAQATRDLAAAHTEITRLQQELTRLTSEAHVYCP